MYAQAAIKQNSLLRNGAYGIVMRGLKANNDTMMLLDLDSGDLPLKESAHIVQGNALRIDWNNVLLADKCSFIMGNP